MRLAWTDELDQPSTVIGEGFFVGSPDRQDKPGDLAPKPLFNVRLVPAEASDGPERLRKAYELVLRVEAGVEQLSASTDGASIPAEQQRATESSGAAEPADGE